MAAKAKDLQQLAVKSFPTAGQGLSLNERGRIPLPVVGIITSDIALGSPSNPSDGDIWIATNVDSNGRRWTFQFNVNSTSSFKWEFVGGGNLYSQIDTQESTTSNVYVDLLTVGPSLTIVRPGDYDVTFGFTGFNVAGGVANYNAQADVHKNGAAIGETGWISVQNGGVPGTATRYYRHNNLAVSDVLKLKYLTTNAANTTFAFRYLGISPIRVS